MKESPARAELGFLFARVSTRKLLSNAAHLQIKSHPKSKLSCDFIANVHFLLYLCRRFAKKYKR